MEPTSENKPSALPPPTLPAAAPVTAPALSPEPGFMADPWRLIGLGAAAAMLIGSLLPWVTVQTIFGTLNAAGTEGDGVFTLAAGVGVGVQLVITRRYWLIRLVVGIIALGIAGNVMVNLTDFSDEASDVARVTAGVGLWCVLVGAAATIAAAIAHHDA